MTPELMRALKPKITPQAATRMHFKYLNGIFVATATLGTMWWTSYFEVLTKMLLPEERK